MTHEPLTQTRPPANAGAKLVSRTLPRVPLLERLTVAIALCALVLGAYPQRACADGIVDPLPEEALAAQEASDPTTEVTTGDAETNATEETPAAESATAPEESQSADDDATDDAADAPALQDKPEVATTPTDDPDAHADEASAQETSVDASAESSEAAPTSSAQDVQALPPLQSPLSLRSWMAANPLAAALAGCAAVALVSSLVLVGTRPGNAAAGNTPYHRRRHFML